MSEPEVLSSFEVEQLKLRREAESQFRRHVSRSSERYPIGHTIALWLNFLQDLAPSTLEAIAEDETVSVPQSIAAGMLARATISGFTKGGKHLGAGDIDRIFDRTIGKPEQYSTIRQESGMSADEIVKKLEEASMRQMKGLPAFDQKDTEGMQLLAHLDLPDDAIPETNEENDDETSSS